MSAELRHKDSFLRELIDDILERVSNGLYNDNYDMMSRFQHCPDYITAEMIERIRKEKQDQYDDHKCIITDGTSRWDISEKEVDLVRSVLDEDELKMVTERLELQSKRIKEAETRKEKLDVLDKLVEVFDNELQSPIKNPYDGVPFELIGYPKRLAKWRKSKNESSTK